jgi:2-octaprenyl-6-methoxyphenol hydroxylase
MSDQHQPHDTASATVNKRFDIVIAGGGFVGMAVAVGLAHSVKGMFRIAVIERMPRPVAHAGAFDGRAVALIAVAKTMLDTLGVWQRIGGEAQAVTAIDITDTRLETVTREPLLHFDSVMHGDNPAAFIVENNVLRRALMETVDEHSDITVFAPETVVGVTLSEAGARVALGGGQTLAARLVIAADGRRSSVAKMAGFKTLEWDAGQTGLVATIAHEKPHEGRAVQHFLPSGPFAVLPMPGNRSSLVWTESNGEARRIMALDESTQLAEIEKRMGGGLGRLSLVSKLLSYPLAMTLVRDFVKPRMALAGDAAHGLLWIAGQGLYHGLKDAAVLVEVLVEAARLGMDVGDMVVLERYLRWRRFDSTSSAVSAAVLNKLFSGGGDALRMLRQCGLGLVERIDPLKALFVEEAAGATGELPKLMKGELI